VAYSSPWMGFELTGRKAEQWIEDALPNTMLKALWHTLPSGILVSPADSLHVLHPSLHPPPSSRRSTCILLCLSAYRIRLFAQCH
jgi:hypothetical protein